ncbi:hypothetical protein Hypma_006477 [Hypsizygus marmoreus]|uniref:SH3 domain-containing protein n=1 Tax=Hypsizygus marmoreus TaxID=39966 RepID=A0A369JZ77_HYPMA|nr:hypothetical protein Hypma_006477 [Hypsizygus marmoreus]
MPVLTSFVRRAEFSSPSNPIYIAGFCIVGAILLGLSIWILIRFQRKRAAAKREENRGAAFLSVRGLVKEGEATQGNEKEQYDSFTAQSNTFSREKVDASIVMPDKVLARPPKISIKTSDDVINFHRQSGTSPQAFTAKPFSFALSASPTLSPNRQSFMSGISSVSRFSVISSNSSIDSNPTTGTARKVRQLFEPVLPDELLLARAGEQVTLVQSFDDGWCLVGREGSTFIASAKSLFKQNVPQESDVELGVVPAWCFLKPVQGLRAERPIRSTSLGITVELSRPGFSSREECISWSNF